MKWLDTVLGRTKPKQANLDSLFALPAAAVTLEAAAGLRPTGQAGLCFKPASGQAFTATGEEVLELVRFGASGSGTELRTADDEFGYRWVVLQDPELDDLVTNIHMATSTLQEHGYGPQLLCSVFGFAGTGGETPCHLVYLYKRASFYPFAPRSGQRRDSELELRVRAALGRDLPVEGDLTRWFALWGLPLGEAAGG